MKLRPRSGLLSALSALVLVCGPVALAQPAAATTTVGSVPVSSVPVSSVPVNALPVSSVPASVDDFRFASFTADYQLGRDANGHATMTTTETLVAEFPQSDQNHGIRRTIPASLDGHPTDVRVLSVTDGSGHARSFSTDSGGDDDDDSVVVTIASRRFVHGRQTYVIRYSQQNVIHYPDNARDEEFYWDVNGVGWAQAFGTVTGRLHVPAELGPALTGRSTCFQGPQGSSQPCAAISDQKRGSGTVFTATGSDLAAHENVTMVVGFRSATFAPRDDSFFASSVALPLIASCALALAALIVSILVRLRRWRSAPGRPTVIAEYQPQQDVDILLAARLATATKKAPVAAILDLAVRGIVRVVEIDPSARRPRFELELIRVDGLSQPDDDLVRAVFGSDPAVGRRQDLAKPKPPIGPKMASAISAVGSRAKRDGFERSTRGAVRNAICIGAAVAMALTVLFAVVMLSQDLGGGWPGLFFVAGVILGIAAIIVATTARPLTARGAEARDHLAGLRMYIDLAEADRMRVLQSPTGALRSSVPPTATDALATSPNDEQVLKLNEKLLPYAELFGRGREWSRILGEAYERSGATPTWYSGNSAFNAIVFTSAVSSLSSSSSVWAGSGSSSSGSGFGGGGFGGGGFSGGGGGGGGGGGV